MEVAGMEVEHDEQEIIQRVAALDIGKAEVVCCVRVPGPGRRRMQEVRTFLTMTRSLLVLSDWLRSLGVTRVVMEATSAIGHRSTCWKARSRPGWSTLVTLSTCPAAQDQLDAVWLCKVAERQMLQPSFVPPSPIRILRDLTRHRVDLVTARTAEKQRVKQLLEDALLTEL